jgi:hypothetical protein
MMQDGKVWVHKQFMEEYVAFSMGAQFAEEWDLVLKMGKTKGFV